MEYMYDRKVVDALRRRIGPVATDITDWDVLLGYIIARAFAGQGLAHSDRLWAISQVEKLLARAEATRGIPELERWLEEGEC